MTNQETGLPVGVETESEEQNPEELFYELLEKMPENMRLYEELAAKRNSLYDALQSHRDKITNIDTSEPPLSHPEETAYAALAVYITDRKLSAIQAEMIGLARAGDWLQFLQLRGREVRVEPLGETSKINLLSDGSFVKRTKKPKNGSLTRLSLTPSDGGSIEFRGRGFGFDRSAHPLFDRFKHEPQFRIEIL